MVNIWPHISGSLVASKWFAANLLGNITKLGKLTCEKRACAEMIS